MSRHRLAALAVFALAACLPFSLDATPPRLEKLVDEQSRRVAEQPSDAGAHNDLANLLVLSGSYDEAEAHYETAIGLDSRLASAHYNLGLLRLEANRLREAERHFQDVLELDPGHGLTHYRLGDIDAARSRNAKATRHYAQAFRLDPSLSYPESHPELLFNRLSGWAKTLVYLAPAPGLRPRRYDDPAPLAQLIVGDLGGLREMVADPTMEEPELVEPMVENDAPAGPQPGAQPEESTEESDGTPPR
jgi:tetratricopeptide (TPR) repeat protein